MNRLAYCIFMSHLVCPLCGKNAPLSTLDPENLPFDLKTVSFRGLGRGRGFAKSEEISIMDDDEYAPVIAKRIEKLYHFFVEQGLIVAPMIIHDDKLYLKPITYTLLSVVSPILHRHPCPGHDLTARLYSSVFRFEALR